MHLTDIGEALLVKSGYGADLRIRMYSYNKKGGNKIMYQVHLFVSDTKTIKAIVDTLSRAKMIRNNMAVLAQQSKSLKELEERCEKMRLW